jgi:poly(A) polymerase
LRAVRLATRFDMTIEAATAMAIRAMARDIGVVSAERVAEELRKLLVHPRRAQGMRLFLELGLADMLLPELLPMKGLPQGLPVDAHALPPPGEAGQPSLSDLWEHVLRVLELLGPAPSFTLALAALLHDVGKPRTVGRTPDRYTFYSHEHVGRRMASEICLRLKLSNDDRERIEWLVEKHQILCDVRQMRTNKIKTLLNHPGIHELVALHRADALASNRGVEHVDYCEQLLREWGPTDLNPQPLFTGHDLTRMGLEPGPLFKKLLDVVREAQLDGSIKNTHEACEMVKRLLKENAK